MHKLVSVCGVPISALSSTSAVQAVRQLAVRERSSPIGSSVHLCNAYTLSLAARDAEYSQVLRRGTLNLPDGTPVVWAMNRDGAGLPGPVRGPRLMLDVMREGLEWGARHYLYGGTDDVQEQLVTRLNEIFPGIRVVGTEAPPFRSLEGAEFETAIQRFRASSADYFWIGLGTPKQDIFVAAASESCPGVFLAVGAAFDFTAGTVREAPAALHGTGLEWIFRLSQDPRRLWRRYLIGNVVFALRAVKR